MRRFLLKGSGLLLALLFTCTLFQSCNKDEMKWDEPDYTVKDKMEMQKAGPVDLEGMMPNDIYSCNESGPDGFTDLKLKFDTQSVMDALGPVSKGDVLRVILALSIPFNPKLYFGKDSINVCKYSYLAR